MIDKLQSLEAKYEELTRQLADGSVLGDPERYRAVAKAHAELSEVVQKYHAWRKTQEDLAAARELLSEADPDLRPLAEEEIARLREEEENLQRELQLLLLPRDPNDEKNVIVEIRAGTGGDEAALFAADLFRMYQRYAEEQGWKTELISANTTGLGGFKEIIFSVEGRGAYSRLKFESGVHRVQRIPATESGGRIHTSTATVAVLPEAEEVDVEIRPEDLRIDVFRASGHGGQHVNTTDSAVRITHLPTGLVVTCQDEKSQRKNKEKAMKVLRARLYDRLQREQREKIAEDRRAQVGTGERSERIRTYNFPQGRVTDHRIGLTLYRLPEVLQGDLDEIVNSLTAAARAEQLGEAAEL